VSRAARTILAFGVYCLAVAAVLIVAPNALLGLLKLEPTHEVYIRVLGVVVMTLGFYYIAAARAEVVAFFRWTVWGRPFVLAAFIALVVAGVAPPILILFGAVDAGAAIWTAMALRESRGTLLRRSR
jgi:hypothetical protein